MPVSRIGSTTQRNPGSPRSGHTVLPEQIQSAEISNLSNIDESIEDSSSSSGNEPLRSAPSIILSPAKIPQIVQRSQKTKLLKTNFKWKKEEFQFSVDIPKNEFDCVHEHTENSKTAYEYFKIFFSDNIIDLIVNMSNLYSVQKTGTSINCSTNDIRDFIAIELIMGIIEAPAYTDYWSDEFRYPTIASIMSLKKYQSIRRYLHFIENASSDSSDRYFKIRPILEAVRANCLAIEEERRHSVDEMMIPYKGTRAGSRRQYVKNKPKKWGFKMFARCGVSGFVYDFMLYAGEDTFRGRDLSTTEQQLGLGGSVVVSLCKTLHNKPCSAVYFDNFFCSLELIKYLRNEFGILSLGTVRIDRLRNCPFKPDKELKKEGRGAFEMYTSNENRVVCIKWFDSKSVALASSFVGADPIGKTKRYRKECKSRVDVPCPAIIEQYNCHMGGVDLADMLIALYRTCLLYTSRCV